MYWKGKVAFYSVPNQIFNHATSQSALINTLMPSSLHCPLGRESSKDTIAMGMCDSYTLNPPLCMDYILPVSSPDVRNPYSFVVVCGNCMVKEVSCCPMRGSTTSTTVPLSSLWRKVCWKEGNPLLQIQRCTSSLTDQPLTSGSGYHTGDIRTPSIPQPYQPYNASQLDSRMDDEELLKHPTKGLFLN